MRFAEYGGFNKQRSSLVQLLPTSWIVRKIKPNRTPQKQREEFFALHLWERVLNYYKSEYRWVQILSPKPVTISIDNSSLDMHLVLWVELGSILSWDTRWISSMPIPRSSINKLKEDTLLRTWHLLWIMKNEGLTHGDFLLRHILWTEENLWVIDVENSWNTWWIEAVERERKKMIDLILSCAHGSVKFQTLAVRSLEEWFKSVTHIEPVIEDLIKEVERDLWFNSRKFTNF